MQIPRPLKIQTKFSFGLVLATLLLGVVFSIGFYFHMRNVLEEEVQDKARLIFTNVDSVQHYVRDVLRPTMYERVPSAFIIQAMSSSYVSREIMAPMNALHGGTVYRRVAIDARNPDYEADEAERELIEHFRSESGQDLWRGYRLVDGELYYLMVRPVRFEQECMYCHGQVENAPPDLVKLYGNRGFGKERDSIAGVDLVGISVDGSVGRVERTILTYFGFFAFGALLIFFAANLLFKVLVVNNLKRLNIIFQRNVTGAEGSALLRKIEQGDEIEELVEGMEQMSEHLFVARSQLENYAENLRKMVEERTNDLSDEVDARRADVHLFVRLLEDMCRSRSRTELWQLALPRICKRFGARRIAYVCTLKSQDAFVWPESDALPDLPKDFEAALTSGACVGGGAKLFVPVEARARNACGLLCLDWEAETGAGQHDREVLLALGRQLGTAGENLIASDNLLRQMNVLETIVEGITDPLALMDSNCAVLTVNQAARRLTAELSKGERTDGDILSIFFDPDSERCPMVEVIRRGAPDQREVSLDGGRSFSLSMYPVAGRDGRTDRVVVYARETTLERHMQEQVLHAEKMATVGKLTAGLAHEINNPLGVILCYTGILRQNLTDPQLTTDLEVIERHTRQAQRVLKDLLNFARPKVPAGGVADACAVAASVTEVFSVQAAKKGARIFLHCPTEPLPVRMDVGELEQVIGNLLLNALDAVADQEGVIQVWVTEAADAMVGIEIVDNGPGVSADDAPYIFDPFYSTKEIGTGTGLGLTVIYGMVTNAGGRVEVEKSSELGGARFTVVLPLVAGRFGKRKKESSEEHLLS